MNRNTEYWRRRLATEDDETVRAMEEAIIERAAGMDEEEVFNDLIHITSISEEIDKEYDTWGKVNGLLTGLPSLDKKLGGLGKGHVVLIGGETSNGKSALAANIAVNIAKDKPVLFITLEMLATEIGARIKHINNGTIDDLDIMFQGKHRISYKDVKPLMLAAIEKGNIELVVLDYMQYLGRGMTEKETAVMSKEIKTLALEFKIPFIVIVALRKSEGGKNKRKWTDIEIDDFMGTSSIGYDCDVAMLASRKDVQNNFDTSSLYIKLLKTRNAYLNYDDRYLQFEWDQTRITEPEEPLTDPFNERAEKDDGFTTVN